MAMKKPHERPDLNGFVDKAKAGWENFKVTSVEVINYGDANMHVAVTGHPRYSLSLTGEGKKVFNAATGEPVFQKSPYNATYYDVFNGLLDRLHFGDFGGLGLRIIYFILGIVSCFVIISGILIWLVARDKKQVVAKKRKFNAWMGHLFLASCIGMFPATAFTFLAVKLFVFGYDASRMDAIYHLFFYSWLAFILFFTFKRDNYFTNKWSLILGAGLGLCVPVANGIISGSWLWNTFSQGHFDIFFIDAFWVVVSLGSLIIALTLKRKNDVRKTDSAKSRAPQLQAG